jgi:hypothetical protein
MGQFCFCGVIENVRTLFAVYSCVGISHVNTVADSRPAEAMCDGVHTINEPVLFIVDSGRSVTERD